MEQYKEYGDLITSNLHLLKKGMKSARVINYYDENMPEVTVALDDRITPAQNAQRYYKKYAKAKKAQATLTVLIKENEEELGYVRTIIDSLDRAENESDIIQIREELILAGYGRTPDRSKNSKREKLSPTEFETSSGYKVLCGRNNIQNDYITFTLASKGDLWFHVKGMPGSHVVLFCGGDEPPAEDFTEAAIIAAVSSKAPRGQKVTVDYTRIKNLKKPPHTRPGYVTFSENYSAYVEADEKIYEKLKK